MSNFSKPARYIFMEIQKIDSSYYPEVRLFDDRKVIMESDYIVFKFSYLLKLIKIHLYFADFK
jgi:hypothetical protein